MWAVSETFSQQLSKEPFVQLILCDIHIIRLCLELIRFRMLDSESREQPEITTKFPSNILIIFTKQSCVKRAENSWPMFWAS